MSAKPRIATVSLAGCFGCHMSLLDIDDRILALAELVEFDRSPINDYKAFNGRCDIGLIEGGCCNEDNVHVLEDFRQHCDVLVSLGDCAISGGHPGAAEPRAASRVPRGGVPAFTRVYNPGGVIPNAPELPLLLNRVYACHEVVKIDHVVPGCPPSADAIYTALLALVAHEPMVLAYADLKYD